MKNLLRAALAALALVHSAVHAGTFADLQIVNRTTGQPMPVYAHGGKLYVAGQPGQRYSVQVANRTRGRVLAVISVDGVNVISGETAAAEQSGYVLSPHQSYEISGWRKTTDEIAAFYFTALPDSYAARTGRPGNVGVIGVALFREWTPPRPRPQPIPRPSVESRRSAPQADVLGESVGSAEGAQKAEAPAAPGMSQDSLASQENESASAPKRSLQRERLGTGHGEREYSSITYTDFRKATTYPSETLIIHYDRHENLVARGIVPTAPRVADPQPFPGGMRFAPDPRS